GNEQKKPISRREKELEEENAYLREVIESKKESIKSLQANLELLRETINTLSDLRSAFQGIDTPGMNWKKWARDLAKKYYPNLHNQGKTFLASEIMADLSPLFGGAALSPR